MKVNIHAGHNPGGRVNREAIGLIKESTEARKVKNEVIRLLKSRDILFMIALVKTEQISLMY